MDNETQQVDRLAHALRKSEQMRKILGHVYFVQCNEFTKIGFAFDVPSRVCNMQIGNPYKLELLKVIPSENPDKLEEELHSQVEQYRERGEWFKLPPEILAELIR